MRTRRAIGVVLGAGLVVGVGQAALAQSSAVTPPPIEVSVDCDSSPEIVTIRNNHAKPIRVLSVGSTWKPRAGEPYRLKQVVKPGKRASYTFGTGKGGKRLSRNFIFDNEERSEAVVVKTSKGRIKVKCTKGTNMPPEPAVTAPAETVLDVIEGQPLDALDLLTTMTVEPEVDEGFARELFKHWVDEDGDGCDTRQEVLIAESLTPVMLGDGCSIEGGTWYSAADGDTLTNSASIDINHVVPLKEAWASGAHAWTPERRGAFANDLLDERTLQAVSSGSNRQQGESDPASWLPVDRTVACQFVADWVAIKASWGLSVDEMEREAVEATLDSCRDRVVSAVPQESEEAVPAS